MKQIIDYKGNKVNVITKTEAAYEAIKNDIIEGAYESGSKIVIHHIAKKYHVSEIPIREALKKLEAGGLVRNIPHAGFVVTETDFKNQNHIFEVRQLLEGQATALAAQNITGKTLRRLKSLQTRMRRICDSEFVKLAKLNYEFHETIYASCQNPTLYKLIQQVWAQAPRTRAIFSLIPQRGCASVEEHERIVSALEANDGERAKQAMLEHKARAYRLLAQTEEEKSVANF